MTEVVSVRFRGGAKNYYFDPKGLTIEPGQYVVVETAQGMEYVCCVEGNHEVPEQSVVQPLRPVVRIATENDHKAAAYNRKREEEAFAICEKKIAAHKLEMKLVNVECNFEGNKIIFFFTAEGRVDFRELVKDLASVFRARIELRQIGVRDEAKMLGGLGICGRPLCCSQFLEEFIPVSIKMAKTQNLSLNPTKISGTCGRLMCCLKYEQNAYEDAAKRMPKNDSFVDTPDGVGNISSVDLLREEVAVRLDSAPESPKRYKRCEICVLRNGKGSREGIEIPQERPQRYTPPEETQEEPVQEPRPLRKSTTPVRETIPIPSVLADETKEESKTGSRRRRSGRRGGDKVRAAEAKSAPEKKERPEKPDKPERAEKPEKAQRPEKKVEAPGRNQKARRQERSRDNTVKVEKVEKTVIRVSGDTTAETISAIIADEAAIGMVNTKTTAVRIIPAPGKTVGDRVEMGGLLGSAPVMPVHDKSSEDFIARGGRIPAPLQSLKN